jgi:hypothetical protein
MDRNTVLEEKIIHHNKNDKLKLPNILKESKMKRKLPDFCRQLWIKVD